MELVPEQGPELRNDLKPWAQRLRSARTARLASAFGPHVALATEALTGCVGVDIASPGAITAPPTQAQVSTTETSRTIEAALRPRGAGLVTSSRTASKPTGRQPPQLAAATSVPPIRALED